MSISGYLNTLDWKPQGVAGGTVFIMRRWRVSGSILKQELIHHRRYRGRRQAMEDITEYIEIFYDRQRLQAGPGYFSPVVSAREYYCG